MKKRKRKKRNKDQTQTQTQITNRDQTQTKPRSQPKPKSSTDPTINPCSQHPHASLQIFPIGFLNGWVVIIDLEVLDENELDPADVLNGVVFKVELLLFVDVVVVLVVLFEIFNGVEKVRPRNWVDSVAELVVKVLDFLWNCFDFFQLQNLPEVVRHIAWIWGLCLVSQKV